MVAFYVTMLGWFMILRNPIIWTDLKGRRFDAKDNEVMEVRFWFAALCGMQIALRRAV